MNIFGVVKKKKKEKFSLCSNQPYPSPKTASPQSGFVCFSAEAKIKKGVGITDRKERVSSSSVVVEEFEILRLFSMCCRNGDTPANSHEFFSIARRPSDGSKGIRKESIHQ